MSITAVVLSAKPYDQEWPGLEVLVHRGAINSAVDHQAARFNAALRVKTTHFFYLDDDDSLPADYLDVLQECLEADAAVAYTDEAVITAEDEFDAWYDDAALRVVRKSAPYEREQHYQSPLLIHHLALYRSAAAREAIGSLPRGHYWPELMLSWKVAGHGAAVYVPRIGYEWRRRANAGLHLAAHTGLAITRTQLWCKAHP